MRIAWQTQIHPYVFSEVQNYYSIEPGVTVADKIQDPLYGYKALKWLVENRI